MSPVRAWGAGRPLAVLAALLAVVLAVPAVASPSASPSTPPLPGPVYDGDFPDPHVLRAGDAYFAYSTTTGGRHLPVLRSTDLQTWSGVQNYGPVLGDALPRPAAWSKDRAGGIAKETWAPAVIAHGGRYLAFYAVRVELPHRFCISVATAAAPTGPFVDATVAPLVCDPDPGGSIDPFPWVDPADGRAYLAWKAEGHPGVAPQRLLARQLDADGLRFAPGSEVRELLRPSLPWHGHVVENPAMVAWAGRHYLFYSANAWNSGAYAQGVAVCHTPLGPCVEEHPVPVMGSDGSRLGRAGGSPFVDAEGRLRLAYHYWTAPATTYEGGGYRRLGVATVEHGADGRVRVTG